MATKLFLNGFVGEVYDFWTDEIKSSSYAGMKSNMEGVEGDIELHINSKGGDAFEGMAMLALLKNHEGNKTAIVDGFCASAATLPLFAMDKVQAHETSLFLFHKSGTMAFGHASDLRKQADELDTIDSTVVDLYMKKFTGSEAELHALLDDDKLITAKQALEYGFIDEIISDDKPELKDESTITMSAEEPKEKPTVEKVAEDSAKIIMENQTKVNTLVDIFNNISL